MKGSERARLQLLKHEAVMHFRTDKIFMMHCFESAVPLNRCCCGFLQPFTHFVNTRLLCSVTKQILKQPSNLGVLKLQKQWPDNTLEPSPECVRDLAPVTVLKYTYRRAVAVDRTLEPWQKLDDKVRVVGKALEPSPKSTTKILEADRGIGTDQNDTENVYGV